jgi:hypothetical protein
VYETVHAGSSYRLPVIRVDSAAVAGEFLATYQKTASFEIAISL